MALAIGIQLGGYEIRALLGRGGMGEVYRARDVTLKRDVAIKVLSDTFSNDPDRLARFQREAEVLATLSHSNIAAIYGLEKSSDVTGIVLELVEGETLAEMIARGPIPLNDALPLARQIADALEAAHEKGVVHRDLKPGNVKVKPDGKVKVLDFGLAKMLEADVASTSLTASPTLGATYSGMIVGTASYMSPEQARGKNVDRRTDIWAFGCVLYEMLTGKKAFESGDTISDAIAAVLKNEVDWSALPADTPPTIRTLLRRCLQKDPQRRLPHIGIARMEIDEGEPRTEVDVDTSTKSAKWQNFLPWIAAVVAVAFAAFALIYRTPAPPVPAAPTRVSAELGAGVSMATTEATPGDSLALSNDGALLAFIGVNGQTRQIYIRRLNELKASPLEDTEGASHPFFSPDGRWIGFFTRGSLKKISVNGGPSIQLAAVVNDRGGDWGRDGSIVFSPSLNTVGLQRILDVGGKPETLTRLAADENTHRWPQILPGGKGVLYTSRNAVRQEFDEANIVVQPLPNGNPKVVVRGGYHARYVGKGYLVYIHDGTLMAAPFSLDRLDVTGDSVPVIENVTSYPGTGGSQFAISANGTLAYLPGNSLGNSQPITWLSRDDKTATLQAMASNWSSPRFSPDGRRLAIDIMANNRNVDIWVYDWMRDVLSQLTFDATDESSPVWTPNGYRIVFASNRGGMVPNLYWQPADGGEIQRLTESSNTQRPGSWHPNGKYFVFEEDAPLPGTGPDLMILPMEGDDKSGWKPGKPTPFRNTSAFERGPRFSRDGNWVAYYSSESGQNEVYVAPFLGPEVKSDVKWLISAGGGDQPVWLRDRNELLYRARDNRIMVVPYTVEGNSFKPEKPRLWSNKGIIPRNRDWAFDVHPDGERLAVSLPPSALIETKQDKVVFIFNFFEELRRVVPPSQR